jgi:type VI secretion system secreted protein Hcp
VDEFEVKRMFDIASPTLFQLCANSTSLKSATLVQRKGGSSQSTMGIAPCHLRIDFYDILLTSVSWDVEDQGIEEKLKFVCRKISVQYKPQKPDGTLGSPVHGEWQFDASSSG